MRFNTWRFLGILFLGAAAFFLAVMQSSFSWIFYRYPLLSPPYVLVLLGYAFSVIGAAIFLSVDIDKERHSYME